jgi:alcohol dehydrogenase (NADP+)
MFANALGSEVYAFTSNPDKVEDIKKLGAHHVVVADNKGEFAKPLAFELDLIISTRDVAEDYPIEDYMRLVCILCSIFHRRALHIPPFYSY